MFVKDPKKCVFVGPFLLRIQRTHLKITSHKVANCESDEKKRNLEPFAQPSMRGSSRIPCVIRPFSGQPITRRRPYHHHWQCHVHQRTQTHIPKHKHIEPHSSPELRLVALSEQSSFRKLTIPYLVLVLMSLSDIQVMCGTLCPLLGHI